VLPRLKRCLLEMRVSYLATRSIQNYAAVLRNRWNLERSVGVWLGSQLKRRGWGRWRAAEALGVRLPKLSAWLDDSADPTARERERITSVFGPGLP
jgi:hypothetical protein